MVQRDLIALLKENADVKNIFVETNVTNVVKLTEIIPNVTYVQPIITDIRLALIAKPAAALMKEVKVCHVIKKLEIVTAMKIMLENVVLNVSMDTMDILFAKVVIIFDQKQSNIFQY